MKTTRDRILDAANRLYYAEGIRAVSLDAIAERAGLTKKTLYYHFRSKDDLVAAYLESRDQPNLTLFKTWFDAEPGPLDRKVGAIFTGLSAAAKHPKWRGCGFLRTIAELANMPGHPAVVVGRAHKKKFEAWIADEIVDGCGPKADNLSVARQIVLLLDGAFSAMLTHRDAAYIEEAGRAAQHLVKTCCWPKGSML